jgi:hypothetical protein
MGFNVGRGVGGNGVVSTCGCKNGVEVDGSVAVMKFGATTWGFFSAPQPARKRQTRNALVREFRFTILLYPETRLQAMR